MYRVSAHVLPAAMRDRVLSPVRRGFRPALRSVVDDLAAFLFPEVCRQCGAGDLDRGRVASGRHISSRLQNGRLRRHVVGPLSLPLRLLCDACCATLIPVRAPCPPAAEPDVVAFQANPALFTLIHALKYDGIVELVPWLGAYMARAARPLLGGGPLVLVPIPLHARRLAARGFNQSALLAHAVGRCLGIPVWEEFLVRRRSTPPLARVPHAERPVHVRGAFDCAARRDPSTRLVLVDDVVTTGATRQAARSALGDDNANGCGFLALCRAREAAPWC